MSDMVMLNDIQWANMSTLSCPWCSNKHIAPDTLLCNSIVYIPLGFSNIFLGAGGGQQTSRRVHIHRVAFRRCSITHLHCSSNLFGHIRDVQTLAWLLNSSLSLLEHTKQESNCSLALQVGANGEFTLCSIAVQLWRSNGCLQFAWQSKRSPKAE